MSVYTLMDQVCVCILRLAMSSWMESQMEADLNLAWINS